jgi:hypothetical protein
MPDRTIGIRDEDGQPVPDAVRLRGHGRLRSEAEALAADPVDRAEAAQVLRDMEALRAW